MNHNASVILLGYVLYDCIIMTEALMCKQYFTVGQRQFLLFCTLQKRIIFNQHIICFVRKLLF